MKVGCLWGVFLLSASGSAQAPVDLSASDADSTQAVDPEATVWALQVSSFATLDSALSLSGILGQAGFEGFVRVRANQQGYWYEVLLGPVDAEQEAKTFQELLPSQGSYRRTRILSGPLKEVLLGRVGQAPLLPPGSEGE
jgi:cell division protein FtsN